jgi:transposase InsO family protein
VSSRNQNTAVRGDRAQRSVVSRLKFEFLLGTRHWCYPLTVTDHTSRFVLLREALESTREDMAFTAFKRLFARRRRPIAICSDNRVSCASQNALLNLSKLSVWWLKLGIRIERIKPGHPRQNGRHRSGGLLF